jgi:putative zinc finger/helix-turn-helix YgiT family protein
MGGVTMQICPYCEDMREIIPISSCDEICVRGEKFSIAVTLLKCGTCGRLFDDPLSNYDSLEIAYKEYRQKHKMVQPEDIKNFRKRYNLTQREMSRLLGWGDVTLTRYENGALQDEAHDKMLRLVMEPQNLLRLLHENNGILSEEKIKGIIDYISKENICKDVFRNTFEPDMSNYGVDLLSGYKKLDFDRFKSIIQFLCYPEGVFKTKLNKLPFYIDFKNFKERAISMTGMRYAHAKFGPVPDQFEHFYLALQSEGLIRSEEVEVHEYIGEILISVKEPDLSIFDEYEIKIMKVIKSFFASCTAKQITDYSHAEEGYKATKSGEIISYEFADKLRL